MPIIFSTHPRSRKRIEERSFIFHPLVKSFIPFGFHDYVSLEKNLYAVLSDSGTLLEESALLGFLGILIRTSTERYEAIDKGTCILGGINSVSVLQAIEIGISLIKNDPEYLNAPPPIDYSDKNVSQKVVYILRVTPGLLSKQTKYI